MASNTRYDFVTQDSDRTNRGSREPPKHLEGQPEVVDEQGEPIKWWWNDFGWIKIVSISNNSSEYLTFYNPYEKEQGRIEAGKGESDKCVGYIPYYDYERKYEITYYNRALKDWKKLEMKDLGGQWKMSLYQDATDEDVREVTPNPEARKDYSSIGIGINDNGYEIYSYTWNEVRARLSWQPI